MIIPEDDGFLPVTSSNLNSFNNIMAIKVADGWKGSGELTYQLATMNRSRGLNGWPADDLLNALLPDYGMAVTEVDGPRKKEINMYADSSARRPELFSKHEINYKFIRNQNPPQAKIPRTSFNPQFVNNRPKNDSRSWRKKPWEPRESMGSIPIEPPNLRPPAEKNVNFPRKKSGLLGDCPTARIPPNALNEPMMTFTAPTVFPDFPPPDFPDFPPPQENRMNPSVYDSSFDGMEPLKNFTCVKRVSRNERESGQPYQGDYSYENEHDNFVPNRKPYFWPNYNPEFKRKKKFSFYRRPWASPMKNQSNSNRRNRRFQ